MKKIKEFILGFLVGALLLTILPVYAAIEEYKLYKADYKLILNNAEYNDPDYPILNYKGKTYVPLKTLIDAFDLNLDTSFKNSIEVSKPSGEWVKVDDYNAKFNDLPFIKSTSEGNIFSVRTSNYLYYFKYENNVWYVKVNQVK